MGIDGNKRFGATCFQLSRLELQNGDFGLIADYCTVTDANHTRSRKVGNAVRDPECNSRT